MRKKGIFSVTALALGVTAACSGDNPSGDETAGASAPESAVCDEAPDYPKQSVQVIVPAAAGGGTDGVARIVASELSQAMDVQFNVVNNPGGGTVIGTSELANAPADGYTLGLIPAELTMVHWLGTTDLTYKDLTPIALLNSDPAAVTVSADASWNSVEALVRDAEADPGTITGSGVGTGGAWHIAMGRMLIGADESPQAIQWVPSDGAAPALQEVLSGGIDVSFASLPENRAMLEDGRVKALGIMADAPDPNFPDVPTLQEQGIDVEFGAWRGLFGPKELPDDVAAELECQLAEMVESESFTNAMATAQYGIKWLPTGEFLSFLETEDNANGDAMRLMNIAE